MRNVTVDIPITDIRGDRGQQLRESVGRKFYLRMGRFVSNDGRMRDDRNPAGTTILDIGPPNPALGIPTLGMELIKSGRTSGVTTGMVTGVNATVLVNYGSDCGIARFIEQVTTSAGLGTSGDSGSVVLDSATLTPIGLFFAGSDSQGIMNPILQVYLSLGVFVDADGASSALPEDSTRSREDLMERARSLGEDPRIERLKAIQVRVERRILSIAGVQGIGIGLAENGADLAFVVYCERLSEQIRQAVPERIEGVPVRLIESGTFRPL